MAYTVTAEPLQQSDAVAALERCQRAPKVKLNPRSWLYQAVGRAIGAQLAGDPPLVGLAFWDGFHGLAYALDGSERSWAVTVTEEAT
jgi:hypothetical protein